MFRFWIKKVLQLIILSLIIIQLSFNSVLAQEVLAPNAKTSPSPNLENTNRVEKPLSTSTNEDNRRVAPSNKSQPSSRDLSIRKNSSRPQDPYEKYYDAIKKFNDELYGEQG